MYSAYKLNKQGDSEQPYYTPFPILSQSVIPCLVLPVASWPAYISQKVDMVVWYSHLIKNFLKFIGIHTSKACVVSEAEVDIFLEYF